jgi:hypothetical protein
MPREAARWDIWREAAVSTPREAIVKQLFGTLKTGKQ